MGELVDMVEKTCPRPECREAWFVCPVIVQLAREIELLWGRVNQLDKRIRGNVFDEKLGWKKREDGKPSRP